MHYVAVVFNSVGPTSLASHLVVSSCDFEFFVVLFEQMRRKEGARSLRKISESGVASLCCWSYYQVLHLKIEHCSP